MTTPRGDGVINVAVPYANGGQVTSTNLNDIVDDAEFNTNAVDDSSVGINGSGKLFVKDDGITTARILNSNVTTDKIADSNVTLAKVANIADDRVLGNISGGAAAPSELTAANVVTMLGTSLMNPTSISGSTNTVVFSNGLTLKFGSHTTSGSSRTQTLNFSDHGGNFSNDCIYFYPYLLNNDSGSFTSTSNTYVRTQTASSAQFTVTATTNGHVYKFIAIGY